MRAAEKILLVDDEPQVLLALEDALVDDHVVIKTQSPREALTIIQQDPDIAVLLTDQRMPELAGDELLSLLGDDNPVRRILVTGYADLTAVVSAINSGKVFAYVAKPWQTDDLRAKVDNALSHYRLAKKLERERALLSDLMENIPDGIAFRGTDRRYLRANEAYARLLGLSSPEDLVGRTLEAVLEGQGAVDLWRAQDEQVLTRQEPLTDLTRSYPSAGKSLVISETIAPVIQPTDEDVGLINIARDVSQRAQMEAALREGESKFRGQSDFLNSILDRMQDGVLMATPTGELRFFNTRARKLLGDELEARGADNWLGDKQLSEQANGEPIEPAQDPLRRAMNLDYVSAREYSLAGPTGERVLVQITTTGVSDGVMMLLRDVTEQRHLQEQLLQSQKMEALGQLAGGVAHDFNNLLTAIQSYADLARGSLAQEHPAVSDLDEILETTQRASRLTRQLLVFGRRRIARPKPTSVNRVVVEMKDMLSRLIGVHIQLATDLAEDLQTVQIDQGNLEQVLLNLVVNARDAMPDGGVLTLTTRMLAGSRGAQPRVQVTCADTGVGMSNEILGRLFEPFFTTKEAGRGTGLGLATVYGIVTQCGGHIDVSSELGAGTTFVLELPALPNRATPTPPPERTPVRVGRTYSVLLVEDEAAVRASTARLLQGQGFRVHVAENAEHARTLTLSLGSEIDLLLTDVMMPDVNGPTLAAELRARFPALRVLFMSGYAAPSERGLSTSIETVLEKPFTPTELQDAVEGALGLSAPLAAEPG